MGRIYSSDAFVIWRIKLFLKKFGRCNNFWRKFKIDHAGGVGIKIAFLIFGNRNGGETVFPTFGNEKKNKNGDENNENEKG